MLALHDKAYNYNDLEEIVEKAFSNARLIGVRGKGKYINVPCAFDIETSSFYDNGDKRACMYIWMLGLGGYCVIGRTWRELDKTLKKLVKLLGLCLDVVLPIYVHNLSYEFQFIKDRFKWDSVFCIDMRKPNYARTTKGIEFRCSYQLSGYSLDKVAENLTQHNIRKLVGDLDYDKVRHSKTELTEQELSYCVHDVLVVMAYIDECIMQEGDITKIPNTKTGYVRREVKKNCLGTGHKKNRNRLYRDFIKGLKLESDEYLQLMRALQGGFTHAGCYYSGKTLYDVDSYDETSAYPTVLLCEKFPMSKSEIAVIQNRETMNYYMANFCCLFDITFYGLVPKQMYEDYISISRCWKKEETVVNNGRVVSASVLGTTLTEQDFYIIERLYEWDKIQVDNFRYYRKQYMPTPFVKTVLDFYEKKTTLKGVDGKEVEYMHAKENLNSLYGMIVTNIIRDEITYSDGVWSSVAPDLDKAIERYNNGGSRFLFYPWGVWVTAYARRNLFSGILSCGNDYVYADTDSLKILNGKSHRGYIEQYNRDVTEKLRVAMKYHGIPFERTRPKNSYGEEKPIGVWDYEGHYKRFKTLGAKRYLVEHNDGTHSLTVAGLNKRHAMKYLESVGTDVFELFSHNLVIPPEHTGKKTHTYIDERFAGYVRDYKGDIGKYDEMSSVHLAPTDYNLTIGAEYANFLMRITEGAI